MTAESRYIDELLRFEPGRTTAGVIRALTRINRLASTRGTAFVYCNAGYVRPASTAALDLHPIWARSLAAAVDG